MRVLFLTASSAGTSTPTRAGEFAHHLRSLAGPDFVRGHIVERPDLERSVWGDHFAHEFIDERLVEELRPDVLILEGGGSSVIRTSEQWVAKAPELLLRRVLASAGVVLVVEHVPTGAERARDWNTRYADLFGSWIDTERGAPRRVYDEGRSWDGDYVSATLDVQDQVPWLRLQPGTKLFARRTVAQQVGGSTKVIASYKTTPRATDASTDLPWPGPFCFAGTVGFVTVGTAIHLSAEIVSDEILAVHPENAETITAILQAALERGRREALVSRSHLQSEDMIYLAHRCGGDEHGGQRCIGDGVVAQVARELQLRGHGVWLDEIHMKTGSSTGVSMDNGLEGMTHFVALVTDDFAIHSDAIDKEVNRARERRTDGVALAAVKLDSYSPGATWLGFEDAKYIQVPDNSPVAIATKISEWIAKGRPFVRP